MGLMILFFGLAAFGIFVIGVIVTLVACFRRKWKFAIRSIVVTLAAVVAAAAISVATFLFVWRPYEPTSPTELGQAYSADFGVLPPSGVTVLKARQVIIGDSGVQWLLLKVSPEEMTRHVAMGFTATARIPGDFNGHAGANAPDWWTPPTSGLQYYENGNWSKTGGWYESRAAMGVDRGAGLLWFVAKKMD